MLISNWEDLEGIEIDNKFKQSGQLATYLSHWKFPMARHSC